MTRFWIGTVSADHVAIGVKGGFGQCGHGKRAGLQRMSAGDGFIYYSPKTSLTDGEPLQAFTAIGRITDDRTYQIEMAPDFHPWRRNVAWVPAQPAPIRPLLDHLDFTRDKPNWGIMFRRGHFEVSAADFQTIAAAMEADLPAD